MSTNPPKPTTTEILRPPWVSLAHASGWAAGSWWLQQLGEQGSEAANFGALACGGFALGELMIALRDRDKIRAYRAKVRRFQQAARAHGGARFATPEEVAANEVFSACEGIYLGELVVGRKRFQVFFNGEGSVCLIGPPGTGKSTKFIATTLLNARLGKFPNLLTFDPTGEIYAITRAALERAGYKIVVMAPFASEVSAILGFPVTDVGLDYFSSLTPSMELGRVGPELQKIATWFIPVSALQDEKSRFFALDGQKLISFLSMHELAHGRKPTPPALHKLIMAGPEHIQDLFLSAEDSAAFGGLYADNARTLGGVLRKAPEQFTGGYGNSVQALSMYDRISDLGRHTQRATWDPRELKNPNQKTALFVVGVLDKLHSHAEHWARTLTYLFDTIAADNQAGAVTALIEEAGGLEMPALPSALSLYRKRGLRTLLVYQDPFGQTERQLGKAATRELLSAFQVKIALGLQESESLEYFSRLCGTQAIADYSLSDRAHGSEHQSQLNHALSHRSVPLLRPEEVRKLGRDRALIVGDALDPFITAATPYWKVPAWNAHAGRSPYYHG